MGESATRTMTSGVPVVDPLGRTDRLSSYPYKHLFDLIGFADKTHFPNRAMSCQRPGAMRRDVADARQTTA